MAALKVGGISMHEQSGEFRVNSEQLGWRGEDGSVASCPLRVVLKAEWFNGKLRVLYTDENNSQQLLSFDGFELSSFGNLQGIFTQYAGVSILNHGSKSKQCVEANQHAPTLLESLASSRDRSLAVKKAPQDVQQVASTEQEASTEQKDTTEHEEACGRGMAPFAELARADSDEEPASLEQACRFSLERDDVQRRYRDSILEGWVMKQSKYLKKWRHRYLVLTPTLLCTFRQVGEEIPTDFMELSRQVKVTTEIKVDLRSKLGDATDVRRALGVTDGNRQYTLVFKNAVDVEAWVREIKAAKSLCDGPSEPTEHTEYE